MFPDNVIQEIGHIIIRNGHVKTFVKYATCSKSMFKCFDKERGNMYAYYMTVMASLDDIIRQVHMTLLRFEYKEITKTELIASLRVFETQLLDQNSHIDIVERNLETLQAIKFNLNRILTNVNVRSNNGVLIGYRDRIFNNILVDINVVNEKRRVTNIFNNFIKGITYFNGDTVYNPSQPVYHRNASCPQRGHPNQKCTIDNHPSLNIDRCYKERLIYDELWNRMLNMQQNKSHLDWLEDTRQAFSTCFPETTLRVSVDLTKDNMPFRVWIRTLYSNKEPKTEIFTHEWDAERQEYLNFVQCYRKHNSIVTTWTNTFEAQGTPLNCVGGKGFQSKTLKM
jgi:hypothetical protein